MFDVFRIIEKSVNLSDFLVMRKHPTILILLFASLLISSCKAKQDVIIPDKDNSQKWEKTEKQMTYEQAVKKHWAMQSKEVKRNAKDNRKRSEKYNAPKKRRGKSKNCNICDNDPVIMDGVRDTK